MSPTARHATIVLILILISATTTLRAQEPSCGPLSRFVGRIRHHRSAPTGVSRLPAATVQATAQSPAADCAWSGGTGADPYGFGAILNQLRAAAGLHPLAYDPELSSWASRNNAVQCRRGIGHHVNPSCVQNCGWNYPDASSAAQAWMNSPGHRENLLSPTVTRFGIALGPGPYWTLNAR